MRRWHRRRRRRHRGKLLVLNNPLAVVLFMTRPSIERFLGAFERKEGGREMAKVGI